MEQDYNVEDLTKLYTEKDYELFFIMHVLELKPNVARFITLTNTLNRLSGGGMNYILLEKRAHITEELDILIKLPEVQKYLKLLQAAKNVREYLNLNGCLDAMVNSTLPGEVDMNPLFEKEFILSETPGVEKFFDKIDSLNLRITK